MVAPGQASENEPSSSRARSDRRSTTRDRLVGTAVAHIQQHGMSVGLEQLSLERVISDSGVSRATAYRQFPSKADFIRDVLTTVVRATRLEGETPEEVDDLLALVAERQQSLGSAQARRELTVEALRRSAQTDYERIATSPQWRTYIALHATRHGLPEGDLRTEVTAVLTETEGRFTDHRATVYTRLAAVLGYRLVPPLTPPDGFRVMADAAGALMTGLVVRATDLPGSSSPAMRVTAFGSTEEADWSWPAHHIVGLVLDHIEPDPQVVWDHARRSVVAATLEQMLQALSAMREENSP